ncbi:MAG: acyl carrier protein [Burkholderiales bacterium]|nr:acyl carrier protein [Burkholderiales bacterium]
MKDEEILERVKSVLAESFEVDPERVTLFANLFDDLGLDSIDAVDLAIKVQEITGKRVQPQEFRTIRTVADVVAAVQRLLDT